VTQSGASGRDPMAGDSIAVDTTHAMKTASRYEQQRPADLLAGDEQEGRARGRFGRDVRPPAALDDVQMADARTTMQTDRAEQRFETARYQIDADAVADAILSRLIAGRTLSVPGADDAR
jgi:hypothetical protein